MARPKYGGHRKFPEIGLKCSFVVWVLDLHGDYIEISINNDGISIRNSLPSYPADCGQQRSGAEVLDFGRYSADRWPEYRGCPEFRAEFPGEIFNSDSAYYGGTNSGNLADIAVSEKVAAEIRVFVPPLAGIILIPITQALTDQPAAEDRRAAQLESLAPHDINREALREFGVLCFIVEGSYELTRR